MRRSTGRAVNVCVTAIMPPKEAPSNTATRTRDTSVVFIAKHVLAQHGRTQAKNVNKKKDDHQQSRFPYC